MAKKKLVLFLGAGFSTDDWKLPVMSRFGVWSDCQFQQVEKWFNSGQKSCAETLVHAGKTFRRVQEWMKKSELLVRSSPENVEQVVTIPEVLRQMGRCSYDFGSGEEDLIDVENKLRVWVWKIYQSCPYFDHDQKSKWSKYAPVGFIEKLQQHCQNINTHLTVVTTNYDLVFESLCWMMKWPCRYPCKGESIQFATREPRERKSMTAPDHNAIKVNKLHGSINFFERGEDSHKLYIADQILEEGNSVEGSTANRFPRSKYPSGDRPLIHLVDSIHQWNKNGYIPAIIPPSYAKLKESKWLRAHWTAATQAISGADAIVFIGYSAPRTDGWFQSFVQIAFSERERDIAPPYIHVIDPSCETLERYRESFQRPITHRKNLREALDDGTIDRILSQ